MPVEEDACCAMLTRVLGLCCYAFTEQLRMLLTMV